MKDRITVATINAEHVADLRRMVDLLAAMQVCWPTARATYDKGTVTVTVARNVTGALAA
ncbi:hypothetical protein L2K70_04890 [Nocardioides KLBMP 9356]|uniref:Uncharacterized protein n=1 Tax=Nocardioides potassii TaxID=2911371 RepID=A0ABS9H9K0_9ACTN|nr:hypothetical protein [Nocardioides potassii]MCF6376932.1 hypothetical protein [Nocardioides potassii]